MLSFMPHWSADCEGIRRRDFLQIGSLAGLGLSLPHLLAGRSATAATGAVPRDVSCILIWTRGGTSHHDTFDPKPDAPADVRGDFKAIDSAVPGVRFAETVPRMAKELKRFAVLRGWNPKNAGHGVAEQFVMSGQPLNPAITHPCYGSVVSHYKGFKTKMPPFVQLGDEVDRSFNGGTAGYLGLQHNPFELHNDPNKAPFKVRDITLPTGIDMDRVERRRSMLAAIDALQRRADLQPQEFTSLDEHYRTALNMITAPETKKAFEIDQEDAATRDAYGRTKFGQSCLLARRLIESGVRFVTVSDGAWDTHQDSFNALRKHKLPPVDTAFPQLLIDLEARGMLDSTLVLWLTDFGRTPKVNAAAGRDHWASAGFAIMAGAGIPGGSVLGRTDDQGGRITHDEYLTKDIAATVYSKLGIPLDLMNMTADGRPMRLNDGHPIREWM